MRKFLSLALLGAVAAASACSDRAASSSGAATVQPPLAHAPRSAAVLERLRGSPWLALSRTVPLTLATHRLTLGEPSQRFVTELAGLAQLRLALSDDPGFFAELAPEGLTPRAPVTADGALVYEDVAPATDLVHVATASGFEELRVLHDRSAPQASSWTLRVGPSVASARTREGRVELLDAQGVVRLASAPVVAVDARGERYEGAVSLSGERLVVTVDAPDAVYPLTVDPLWSTTAAMKVPRRAAALVAYGTGKALAIGGTNPTGTTNLGSVELYDAATNTWTLQAAMKALRGAPQAAVSGRYAVVVDGVSSEVFDGTTWTLLTGPGLGTPTGIANHSLGVLAHFGTKAATYEVATSKWTTTPVPNTTGSPELVTLSDGRVLLTGGTNPTAMPGDPVWTGETEIFNPSTRTFTLRASGQNLGQAAWTVLGTVVYGFGGASASTGAPLPQYVTTVQAYDVTTNVWSLAGNMFGGRTRAIAITLPSGNLMVLGGFNGADATTSETFSPITKVPGSGGTSPTGLTGSWAKLSTSSLLVLDQSAGGAAVPRLFGLYATGAACLRGYECVSGACVDGICCGTSTCPTGARCDLPTKKGTCSKPLGLACAANADCELGFCVDGVCCNSACSDNCAACNAPGLVGTCSAITGAPRSTRPACPDAGSADPCKRQLCDGADTKACHFAPKGTILCGANACAAGTETHVATCNGAGACGDVARSCGNYGCDATACKTTCAANADCATGFYCDTAKSACVPFEGTGRKCGASSPCGPGLSCVEGYCCTRSACDATETCATPGKEGNCLKKNGTTCAADAECGTGSCVDGVCCDGACGGSCEACDVAGAVGTCAPVVGAPHGKRAACPGGGDDKCAATACDGKERARCAASAGSDVACRAASCKDAVLTAPANCDGSGKCPAVKTSTCNGYLCADATSCRTTCGTSADCAPGYACNAGKCEKAKSSCSADGVNVIDADGSATTCAPYLCVDGACKTSCTTSSECAGGQVCDVTVKACVAPAAAQGAGDDGGGCSHGRGTTGGARAAGGSVALLALLAVEVGRRTRRRERRGAV